MVKIIETYVSSPNFNKFADHQSRVIEVNSWNDYVEEIKTKRTVCRKSCLGYLFGVSIPRNATIENLIYDDFHLSCDVINYEGQITKLFSYLIVDECFN